MTKCRTLQKNKVQNLLQVQLEQRVERHFHRADESVCLRIGHIEFQYSLSGGGKLAVLFHNYIIRELFPKTGVHHCRPG